jgi:hypothetical protein
MVTLEGFTPRLNKVGVPETEIDGEVEGLWSVSPPYVATMV